MSEESEAQLAQELLSYNLDYFAAKRYKNKNPLEQIAIIMHNNEDLKKRLEDVWRETLKIAQDIYFHFIDKLNKAGITQKIIDMGVRADKSNVTKSYSDGRPTETKTIYHFKELKKEEKEDLYKRLNAKSKEDLFSETQNTN
ncbi:MAG: hypothetical protein GY830_10970 [Bacteroidetes bacterium]|nr:hypothetical protein [Bacteroidota bacterium]